MKNALIVFTRVPVPGHTKTRMMPYCTPAECAELHRCILRDLAPRCDSVDADLFLCYTGADEPGELTKIFGSLSGELRQVGEGVGQRMENAMAQVLAAGYDRCVLIGTDIPELREDTISEAFKLLGKADVVLTPTYDGGYCLIGMKKPSHAPFDITGYGGSSVLENTIRACEEEGLTVARTSESEIYHDIDTRKDLAYFRYRMKKDPYLRVSNTGWFAENKQLVSIIVPVYNESAVIQRFMDMLEPYREQAEILFVDGGSSDDTVELIEPRFKVIRSGKGRAVQMNTGARESMGDVLLFLHADSLRLPKNMIQAVRKAMRRGRYGCFRIDFPSRKILMRTNQYLSNRRSLRNGIVFGDQGLFIGRQLFFVMDGFKEIPIMEDFDLSLRLKKVGYMPVEAEGTILSSDRRYGKSNFEIHKVEYQMWKLRQRYLQGEDPEILAKEYRDIR